MSSEGTVWRSPELCWTCRTLRRRSGSAPEPCRGRSREAWGALGKLSGASGDAPGTPRKRFWEVRRRPEAKTVTCLKMMTLTALWLCFLGPKSPEMRSKCVKNGFRISKMTSEVARRRRRAALESSEATKEALGGSRTAIRRLNGAGQGYRGGPRRLQGGILEAQWHWSTREMREMREIRAELTAHAVHSELVKRMRADWRRRAHTLDPDT